MVRVAALIALAAGSACAQPLHCAVLISANAEWREVRPLFESAQVQTSPYGEYFFSNVGAERVLFFHGGWGKVAAAGSIQYVIDHFHPARLINLGTCGGVEGRILSRPVVDHTGLTATYDYKLEWAPDEFQPATEESNAVSASPLPSLDSELQAKLGLRIMLERGPVEVINIDHAESRR